MRTDSNTVSSLPLSAVSKKPTLVKVASENGASFASDFNKANEALSGTRPDIDRTKRAPEGEATSSSDSAVKSSLSAAPSTLEQPNDAEQAAKITANAANNGKMLPSSNSVDSSDLASQLSVEKLGEVTVSGSLSTRQTAEQNNNVNALNNSVLSSSEGVQPNASAAVKNTAALRAGALAVSELEVSTPSQDTTEKSSLLEVSKLGAPVGSLSGSGVLDATNLSVTTDSLKSERSADGSGNLGLAEGQSQSVSSFTNGLDSDKTNVPEALVVSPSLLRTQTLVSSALSEDTSPVISSAMTTLSERSVNAPLASPAILEESTNLDMPVGLGFAGEAFLPGLPAEASTPVTHNNVVQPSALSGLGKWNNYSGSEKTGDATALDPLSEMPLSAEEGELSWVLSQMSVPTTKSASVGADVVVDATKMASVYTAGVSVAAMSQSNSADTDGGWGGGSDTQSAESVFNATDLAIDADEALVNEPIELRKKEHEALLGRMSAQSDLTMTDRVAEDKALGGLTSSMQNNANKMAAVTPALVAGSQANNLAMSVPPGHPGWAGEMTQKVAWVAREGGHTAHIRLDPPELGSLTVKVSVDNDANTQVSFMAATPQARDLLEAQMGRLRDMLAQQGMDLSRAEVDVSQQDTAGAQDNTQNRRDKGASSNSNRGDMLDDEPIPSNVSYVSATGVDYYA